jgi:DNA polymerase III epsilon subunit family exonuclease
MLFSKFIAFDLETTGLSKNTNEIIEVGAVKFTVKQENGKIVPQKLSEFQSLVKPNMLIPAEATKVNQITDEMVEKAPDIASVLRKFTSFVGQDAIMVAHNAPFDTGFLKLAYENNPQLVPGSPIIDSYRIARSILPELENHKLGDIANNFKKNGLISMKINSTNMHRAVYDCEMLMEIFVVLLGRRITLKDWELGKTLAAITKLGAVPAFLNK